MTLQVAVTDKVNAGPTGSLEAEEEIELRHRLRSNSFPIEIQPENGVNEPRGRMTVFSILADPAQRDVKIVSATFVKDLCGQFTKCR